MAVTSSPVVVVVVVVTADVYGGNHGFERWRHDGSGCQRCRVRCHISNLDMAGTFGLSD